MDTCPYCGDPVLDYETKEENGKGHATCAEINKAERQGELDRWYGIPVERNRYRKSAALADAWKRGWQKADKEAPRAD